MDGTTGAGHSGSTSATRSECMVVQVRDLRDPPVALPFLDMCDIVVGLVLPLNPFQSKIKLNQKRYPLECIPQSNVCIQDHHDQVV